jgi:alpha-L-arabinofuranosidase
VTKKLAALLAFTLVIAAPVPAYAADPELPPGATVDNFDGTSLGPDWEVLNNDPTRWSLTERPGYLRVNSLRGDTYQSDNSARNLFFQDVPAGDFQILASFEAPVSLDFQGAGILAWQDADNYLRAGLTNVSFGGGPVIENALEVNAAFSSTFTARPGSTGETLKVARVGDVFTTSYWDGAAWVQAAQVTSAIDVKKVGVYALSAQNGTTLVADFDYVAILAPDGQPVVPDTPFALETNDTFFDVGATGAVTASDKRATTQLVVRAADTGDGTVTLTEVASGDRLAVRTNGRVALADNPRAGSDRFKLVDAGGGKVRVSAPGGYLTVADGQLKVAATGNKFVVRPYAIGGELTADGDAAGKPMSDRLYGIFYEDINYAADGGLYAELVRNRSFEFNSVDNRSFTGLTAWSKVERGATGTVTVAGTESLNDKNLNNLVLESSGAGVGVSNTGYNAGVVVREGAAYDFSVWARTTSPTGTPLTVTVESGSTVYGQAQVNVASDTWTKYTARITATGSTSTGRLVVMAGSAGTIRLDMVSLFPKDTYKGRKNGMRKDLAQSIAALKPQFLRFPGGCVTNVGNYAPFPDRRRIYRWKETVGPVEQRPTNFNFWGYNQTYGIGYFEYFQFAEDLGAEALPVVSVGVNGCNEDRPLAEDQLGPWVQDTLDLIEFANGGVNTEWGSVRAAMGHPQPFGLEYIGLGNEEIYPEFYRNYPHFARAIAAAYPDIKIITNSGQTSAGAIFDRGWEFAREQNADMVDEHYYNSPEWFLANNRRYDNYDRNGPKVFVGEYASRGNTFYNALSEASFITGLERNSDVVELASYAPLLANVDHVQWSPDLIWFDNDQLYGSTSYYVQKMFSENGGGSVLPSTYTPGPNGPPAPADIAGSVGLATWNTQAVYDDVKVTAADGTTLFADDFSAGAGAWSPQSGTWAVQDGAYAQSSGATDARSTAGSVDWSNYTLELTARKTGGAEGFLVMFGVKDTGNYYWWNLGGWGNTTSALEKSTGGAKATIGTSGNTIETGRTYHIKITVNGRAITTYLDGVKVNDAYDSLGTVEPLYQVVTRDDNGDVVLKVVNARDTAARTAVRLDGAAVGSTAKVTSYTASSPSDMNTLHEPTKAVPVTFRQGGLGPSFEYDFPAQSVTFIRLSP